MSKPQIYNIYKPLGLTPLEALKKLRLKKKLPKSLKMSYAGRLDPMAEGVLLIVAGAELKNKEKYLKLDKTYKAKILFGISTDSQDLLGKITKISNFTIKSKDIIEGLKNLNGELRLPLPAFSSPSFKKDYLSARKGKRAANEKLMIIKSLKITGASKISSAKLLKYINKTIPKVTGDFRQKEILKIWKQKLKAPGKFTLTEIVINCGSGTYIRSLAHHLGKILGGNALLFSLKRLKVGKYESGNSISLS